jgi:hypothetical protein
MKKYILVFLGVYYMQLSVEAQSVERQVVSAAGKFSTSPQLSLSYTIGEANSVSLFSPSIILTQGFQQPATSTVSVGQELKNPSISIFPSPAKNSFSLHHQLISYSPFLIEVYNASGQLISSRKCEASLNGTQTFQCADWAAGTYSLRLIQSGQNLFSSKFQIVR